MIQLYVQWVNPFPSPEITKIFAYTMWSRITGTVCNSIEVCLTVYLAHDLLAMAEVKNARKGSGFKSTNVAIPKYHSLHKMHWEILEAKKK